MQMSPFPGMDPYLEGDLWPDMHHALAAQIRRQLMPVILPKYVARISRYIVEDHFPESEAGSNRCLARRFVCGTSCCAGTLVGA